MTKTLKQKLEAALGNKFAFAAAMDEVRTLSATELKSLAREFTGLRTASRRAAINAIYFRHQNLMVAAAKSLAVGGRSAA